MSGEDLVVRPGFVIPDAELEVAFSRSGGPGGQNVNKVETRVTLRWSVARSQVPSEAQRTRLLTQLAAQLRGEGELILHASASRSQARNLAAARANLAELVRAGLLVSRVRRKSKPTRASRERRHEGKRRRSEIKRRRRRPGHED